jgi:uncharacterized protein YlxW (UPF0749 family)
MNDEQTRMDMYMHDLIADKNLDDEALKLKKQSSMQQREIARLQNEVTNLQSRISELIDIEDKKNG